MGTVRMATSNLIFIRLQDLLQRHDIRRTELQKIFPDKNPNLLFSQLSKASTHQLNLLLNLIIETNTKDLFEKNTPTFTDYECLALHRTLRKRRVFRKDHRLSTLLLHIKEKPEDVQ